MRVCCDFLLNRCAVGELCPRTHGLSPYGLPSFMPIPVLRYEALSRLPGGPHGALLALNHYSCTLCQVDRLWYHFPDTSLAEWAIERPPTCEREHLH